MGSEGITKIQANCRSCAGVCIRTLKAAKKAKKGKKFAKPRKDSVGLKAKQEVIISQMLKMANPQLRGCLIIWRYSCFQVLTKARNSPTPPKAGIMGKISIPS